LAQTSPILRFALEIFHHALETYASATPRHRKIAVLTLAQSVELAVKAALIENNVPIFDKGGRTINTHDGLANLAKLWSLERIEGHARMELLVDERNEIQHRYGNVDEVSLDYHMETAFQILRGVLKEEFDTDLDGWIRDNVAADIWRTIRFVDPGKPQAEEPTAAIIDRRSPTLDFIDGFARFERSVRASFAPYLEEWERFTGSTLDVMIKALSNAPSPNQPLIQALPGVYRLRNRAIHGDQVPTEADVSAALRTLDEALTELADKVPTEVLSMAVRASMRRSRGTKLMTRTEEAQEAFKDPPPQTPDSDSR
jgi:HEPN domain-containing protein